MQEKYPEENSRFLEAEGIRFFQFSIPGNKEPFVHSASSSVFSSQRLLSDLVHSVPEDKVRAALACVLDVRNHPLLIHCNKGKVRCRLLRSISAGR